MATITTPQPDAPPAAAPVFTIPATVEEAAQLADAAGDNIVKNKWALAAIVAAYVKLGAGQGRRTSAEDRQGRMSARAFARLGIHGLTDKETVVKFLHVWLAEFEIQPEPGDEVPLPVEFGWPGPSWEAQGETPTTSHETDADYAHNVRLVDSESDAVRAGAGGREVVLYLTHELVARFADDCQVLMQAWATRAVRDVVLRAVREAADEVRLARPSAPLE